MLDVKKIRQDFPMLDGNKIMQGHKLVYLDNASTTFKPKCVLDAIANYYQNETSNSHRGDYDLCYNMDVKIEEARHSVSRLLNCENKEVVFTSGTSMSINLIAYGYGMKYLTENDEVLLTVAEHASNVLPWFKVSEIKGTRIGYIPLDENGRLTRENVEKISKGERDFRF